MSKNVAWVALAILASAEPASDPVAEYGLVGLITGGVA